MTLRRTLALGAAAIALAAPATAQDRGLTYSLSGTPGLIDMPSALVANDGQIAGMLMLREGETRTSFTFQASPRLSMTFRYTGLQDYDSGSSYHGRGLDLRYQIMDEGDRMPAIAVGLQDFLDSTPYSGEYIVATKTFGDSFRLTAGVGWGRFGEYGGPVAPSDGSIPYDTWFQGDAAVFGGIEWAPNGNWLIKAEYAPQDAYRDADGNPLFESRSPLNFGVTWRAKPGYQIGLSYLHGSEIALTGTLLFNPHERPFAMGLDSAPTPVTIRPAAVAAAQSWDRAERPEANIRTEIATALAADGFTVDSVELTDRAARIRYTNSTYRAEAQGLGRVARMLTGILPGSVESITLEPMRQGIPLSAVTFRRSDIESLENAPGGTQGAFDRAIFADAGGDAGLVELTRASSPFSWGISPYGTLSFGQDDGEISIDVGLQGTASYAFAPNLLLSGALRYSLVSQDTPTSVTSGVHPVRSLSGLYAAEGNPGITSLQLAWYDRPGRNLYSRVTVGYLEPMFGGVSTELLYSPVETRWAVGAELNYVAQRSSDMMFGFGDYCTADGTDICGPDIDREYRTLTGHLSLYYALSNDLQARFDVGRYLAGDWGATAALDREFGNGWRIGGEVTVTDAHGTGPGQDAYSAGIRISMPADFLYGTPSRSRSSIGIDLQSGDAGARLGVSDRLYDFVREGQVPDLESGWGRFWR